MEQQQQQQVAIVSDRAPRRRLRPALSIRLPLYSPAPTTTAAPGPAPCWSDERSPLPQRVLDLRGGGCPSGPPSPSSRSVTFSDECGGSLVEVVPGGDVVVDDDEDHLRIVPGGSDDDDDDALGAGARCRPLRCAIL